MLEYEECFTQNVSLVRHRVSSSTISLNGLKYFNHANWFPTASTFCASIKLSFIQLKLDANNKSCKLVIQLSESS